jgi:hypothetical protein
VKGNKLRTISLKKSGSFFSRGNPRIVYILLHIFCRSRKDLPAGDSKSQNVDVLQDLTSKAWILDRRALYCEPTHGGVICHSAGQRLYCRRLQMCVGRTRHLRGLVRARKADGGPIPQQVVGTSPEVTPFFRLHPVGGFPGLGDNGRVVAQIQGLPGPAAMLNGATLQR